MGLRSLHTVPMLYLTIAKKSTYWSGALAEKGRGDVPFLSHYLLDTGYYSPGYSCHPFNVSY